MTTMTTMTAERPRVEPDGRLYIGGRQVATITPDQVKALVIDLCNVGLEPAPTAKT